ncbi:MAG: TetR/AcrR family transcriptional regulator [Clostridia bacterium]|nr:TetR/AcrR family transcriptional regulator [Clostridia bacterium]
MKREMIYEEVLAMLNDRVDYKSITLSEVAKRCGMGKSTIYEYFASKDEMVFNSIIFYLNRMVKFFSAGFKVTTFRASLKTFIKAVIITMKANYWMVMPWTFLDNYAPFLDEEDADTITEMLYKCKEVILALFTSICEKGEEEGVLFEISDSAINFAYNGIIGSLSEEVDAEYDLEDDDSKLFIEELATNVVKQLN